MQFHTGVALRILVIVMLMEPLSTISLAASGSLEQVTRSILLQRHDRGGQGRLAQMTSYVAKSGESIEALEDVLIGFVEKGWRSFDDSDEARILCDFSIEVLGELRSRRAIPVLRKVAGSENDIVRRRAVRSLANMGGSDSLEFARQVISDSQHYTRLDRRALYETLIRNLAGVSDPVWLQIDSEARQLLVRSVDRESSVGNVVLIDSWLADSDQRYRVSFERESLLARVHGSGLDRYQEYVDRELQALVRMPERERTHVDVGR